MREIKIVLNNNQETCIDKPFSIYIDDEELRNFDKFTLVAKNFTGEELRKGGFLDFNNVIKYSIEHYAPYWEETESNNDFQTKTTQ